MHFSIGVSGSDDRKSDIDVMENVFGGVRISPDDEPRSQGFPTDPQRRPWLTGVTVSSVRVEPADDADKDDQDRER
jgi:hypothetical protein